MAGAQSLSDQQLLKMIQGNNAQKQSSVQSMSDDQLMSMINSQPNKSNLLTNPAETLMRSGGEFFGSIANAIGHPIQTAKALGGLGVGTVQKVIPGRQAQERYPEAVVDMYKNRYGSLSQAGNTALEDPVGVLSDLAILASGGGAAASKIGQVGKVGKLQALGSLASKTANTIDPLSATLRLAGKGVEAATAGRKIAPFASKLDQPVMGSAQKLGVDLPASAISTSKAVPAIEAIAGKGFFGEGIAEKVAKAQERLNQVADNLVAKTGKSSDLVSAGKSVFQGAEYYRDNFMKVKNVIYQKAVLPEAGKIIEVTPTKSMEFIDSVLQNKQQAAELLGSSQDIQYFSNLRKGLNPTKNVTKKNVDPYLRESVESSTVSAALDGRKVQSAIRELNEKIKNITDPIATGNKATLKKLVTLLSDDLDNAIVTQRPDLADSIKLANKFYKDGINKLNSSYGEKIFDLGKSGQFDKIVPAITSPGSSVEDIPKIFKLIGQKNVPSLQSAFLEEFFKGSKSASGTFTPLGISRQISKYGDDKLKALLTPDQYNAVQDLANVTRGLGKAEKIAGGSQTAFLLRLGGQAALFFVNPLASLKPILGDAMFSKFVSSKVGQDLLSTGRQFTGKTGRAISGKANAIGATGRTLRLADLAQEKK